MSFKGVSDDTEAESPSQPRKNAGDLFKSYSVKGDENQSENEEPDVMVPIVEIQCEDSDEQKSQKKAAENTKSNDFSNLIVNGDPGADSNEDVKSGNEIAGNDVLPYVVNFIFEECINNESVFMCDLCGAGFRLKHSITKHKRVVHGMHQFICMFCKNSYPLKRNLLEHIGTHKGPDGFKCMVCNKVRPNYVSIQRHVKTHAQKSFPCIICGAWFKTKWELKSHEIQHKEDRQLNCGTCKRSFINPSKLREHMTQHVGERPFKCEVCGKGFNAQGNLTNHRKLHFNEKPFKCQYCSLSFLTNSARKRHIPVHEREKRKPYQCQDCDKKYTSTTSLAVHRMKFHSEGRIFHCTYCKQKFKSKSDIAEHVAEHAAERPYSCQHCLCRYKIKRELRRHQREKKHYDTQVRENERPLPSRTAMGSLDFGTTDSVPLDEEEGDDLENEDWEMPEPEVCIKVADSDEENVIFSKISNE